MEQTHKPTPAELNELRNTLGNAYSTLDSYLKSEEATTEQIQLMTAKLLNIVIEKAFEIKTDYNNG